MRHLSSLQSDSMQRLHTFMSDRKIHSGAEIQRVTRSIAVSTEISNLRHLARRFGQRVDYCYGGLSKNNRKISLYQLV